MADEREWVPVEVLWDERRHQQERFVADFWSDEFDEAELNRRSLTEDAYQEIAHLSRRKRKRARGDDRLRGR